ncbi:hypothetical protein GCM10023075_13140 [Streptosporangium album]
MSSLLLPDAVGEAVPVGLPEFASAVHPIIPAIPKRVMAPRTATRLTLGTVALHFAVRPTTLARHNFPPLPH